MSKRAIRKSFFTLVLLLSVVACQGPTDSELEGSWVVSPASRDLLPSQFRGAAARLVLNADGSFYAQQLPLDVESLGIYPLLTGDGVWRLDVRGREYWVLLNFTSVNGDDEDFGFRFGVSSSLSGQALYFFWGDVDLRRRVALRKE